MKNKSFWAAFAVLLPVSLFLILSGPASAQTMSMKISPTKSNIELVEPGGFYQDTVTVTNESQMARTFFIYLRDFGAEGETGSPRLLPPGTDYGFSIASWVEITKEGIELAPGQSRTISYVIKVPEEAGPGGYRGAIVFGTEPPRLQIESEDKGAGMSVAQQAASLILLQVKGEVTMKADIEEFFTDKEFYSTPFSVDFVVRVRNDSNVHIEPHGTISINNMFGKEVQVIRVNEKAGAILPQTIRRFTDINWKGEKGFGKYTAELGLTYGTDIESGGQGKGSMVSVKTFWIIPWKLILPVGGSMIILFAVFFFLLRIYRNRAIKAAMERAGVKNMSVAKRAKSASPGLHLALIILASFIILLIVFMMIYILFIA